MTALRRPVPTLAAGATSLAVAATIVVHLTGALVLIVIGLAAAAVVLAASPAAVVGLSIAAFGLYQVSDAHPIPLGPVSIYTTDLLLVVLVIRGLRSRQKGRCAALGAGVQIAFAAFVVVMFVAALHGAETGQSLDTLVRRMSPVFFYPGYVFGFTCVLAETRGRLGHVYRTAAQVALGFLVWMVATRVAGHHFERVNHLGKVVLSDGELVRRDYGFATAFIIYPLLAVYALGGALRVDSRLRGRCITLGLLGFAGTLMTLVRGEIYGLAAAILVLLVLVGKRNRGTRSLEIITAITGAAVVGAAAVAIASPALGRAIVERSLPDAAQSAYATQTAEYRLQALDSGLAVASHHPLGLGLVSDVTLATAKIDPGFVAHSAPAWLLTFAGWPGLVAGIACVLALLRVALRGPYRHGSGGIFAAVMTLLVLYSASASGVLAQPAVVGVSALAIAVFRAAIDNEGERGA